MVTLSVHSTSLIPYSPTATGTPALMWSELLLLHGTEDATPHSTPPVAQPSPSEKQGSEQLLCVTGSHCLLARGLSWFYTRIMI